MSTERQKAALFASAALLRLLLFTVFPSLPDLLTGRVEISTPVTSFKRLQEGLFLYTHGVSPYDGGVYHQAPLLLPLFALLPNALNYPFATNFFFIMVDLLSAVALMRITETAESVSSKLFTSSRSSVRWNGVYIGAASVFVQSFYYSNMLSSPVDVVSGLLYLSYIVTGGSWEFLFSTYGVQLLLPDLTPNVGLWWYFFIEMFDSFREFFLGVFWLHLASYIGGLSFRVRRQPLFVVTCLLGIFAIFKPYPSISDTSLFLALLPLYRHVFPLMRYTFLATSTMLYATLLGPAFYYLWIYAGSGNANFFYAITLVWSLGLSILVADLLFAVLRDEWEVDRPEMKGKSVRRI
ncbi:MAG: hypothetical protein M1829_001282 [Trizodia sp. TS-e1964]|nr:MAG: hypothetical protein M1829_001282 [Trizodia sp. TS-e1964]